MHPSPVRRGAEENASLLRQRRAEKKRALKAQIDALLKSNYQQWVGPTEALTTNLGGSNRKLQACIADIETNVNRAERVTKAFGTIDEVITMAAKILP